MITKARLVARGFEDQGKKGSVDSPTCPVSIKKMAVPSN